MKIHINRLKKLADHLVKGKLGHDKFNFAVIHIEQVCSTAGCAIGEMITVWPKMFMIREGHRDVEFIKPTRLEDGYIRTSFLTAMKFFGLSEKMASHLFSPHNQKTEFGGKSLGNCASANEVAENIYEFIKLVKEGKIQDEPEID